MGKLLRWLRRLWRYHTCLGMGEEEDDHLEDCYVPLRSIYDTTRINEEIDQRVKHNEVSKSTLGKRGGSTISSNGTLGAANIFKSRAPETKRLDERAIFNALKLSSDISEPAPAPPQRRANPKRKISRWLRKFFMPPNFTKFVKRMGASLRKVSEAGTSSPSLRDKRESSAMLNGRSGQPDRDEPMSESLTLEHVSKSPGTAEALTAKQLSVDGYAGPQDEHQPLLNADDSHVRDVARARQLQMATWPRARKNLIQGNLSDGHQETLEASKSDCLVESVRPSFCLSELQLDAGLDMLVTAYLREKMEYELRFQEDERQVMMEEWEEATLSERGKAVLVAEKKNWFLANISKGREQFAAPVDGSAPILVTSWSSVSLGSASSPLPSSTCCTEEAAVQCEAEDFALGWERSASPMGPELSDTDSVQMFLELEKQCLEEDVGDGAVPGCLEAPTAQALPGTTLHPPSHGGASSPAPSEEEVPVGTEGPPGTACAAEGPPAVPDGSAPGNEVAQRVTQLQEALVRCEKFQDVLEPLLRWLADTEELISTQKPPSAEYRVVNAQIQQQELAEKFWYDMAALLTTIKDTRDIIVHDLESPGIDPSIIKQQTIKEETYRLHEQLEFIWLLGTDLNFVCDEIEKPEVKKSIDEMNNAWENLSRMWKERLEKLEKAMQLVVQYQDTIQAMLDGLDNAVTEQCNVSPVSTDLSTVKEQMNEMKFHKAWKKQTDWLEVAENHLDSELKISSDPDKIKLQLSKHKEFQKTLEGKQPVYDTTIRTGRALEEKALLLDDTQNLDNFLGEVQDKWDTVCGKSVERQDKLEEAMCFSPGNNFTNGTHISVNKHLPSH